MRHARRVIRLQRGQVPSALRELYEALERFGPDHFGTGRVLDTLGACCAMRQWFTTAEGFYLEALRVKRRFHDDAGLMITHGQLGRLYLDWNEWDRAERHFVEVRKISERIGHAMGVAQMCNHLGQIWLARGRPKKALELLTESVTRSQTGGWAIREAFALKDRADASIRRLDDARADVERASMLFDRQHFAEGTAHAARVHGRLRRGRRGVRVGR